MIKDASLSSNILAVIRKQATEPPHSGIYNQIAHKGTYLCRACGLALLRTTMQFSSHCGWPSFDEAIPNTILERLDKDEMRTEIICARCEAHLGHVFRGEGMTLKNLRHCINSVSLDFVEDEKVLDTEEAILAAGCFWGVEYYLKRLPGVLKTEVGYTGGDTEYPSYENVCHGSTGHVEAIRVVYDPKKISYENLLRHFFEIHDPTQVNGQGPDIGQQYLSVIFYYDENQKNIAEKLINMLRKRGFNVATTLLPVRVFWLAEIYHQDYYAKTGKMPYCHSIVKRFE